MAVTYGFYNSLNKDRMYNAEQMSSIFNGIITDGVFASIGGSLMPIAGTGMQVVVKTGKCWFNSTWTLNDALLPLDILAADVSLTRIDAIVVEINSAISTRANIIKVIKGVPSANPAKPALANAETLHQYALGYVTVNAGVTSITADKIEVNVGKATCPFITSVLQQTDITALFNQWDAEFNTWFANIQSQLSGDIAANLQRQIDALKPALTAKGTIIGNITAQVLQVDPGSNVDDALLKLAMPEGKYAVSLTLLSPGGRRIPDVVVNGINTITGGEVKTDANGEAFGFTSGSPATLSVNLASFLDLEDSASKVVSLISGTINAVELSTKRISGTSKLITTSGSFYFSPDVSDYDCSAIGGGQNGDKGSGQSDGEDGDYQIGYGGYGGDAGGILNVPAVTYNSEKISVIVGAVNGKSKIDSKETPNGARGGGGAYTEYDPSASVHSSGHNAGNGNPSSNFLYPPTSVGGAGGGGGIYSYGSAANRNAGKGGSPGGGNGNASGNGANGSLYGSGGGGGAVGLVSRNPITYSGGTGKPGCVGFVWRYK